MLLAVTLLLSCQDDDASSTEPVDPSDPLEPGEPGNPDNHKKTFTFSIPAGYPDGPSFQQHIIISDDKGNVLGSTRLVQGTTYSLTAPEGFTGKDVTVTLLSSSKLYATAPINTYLYTYTNVPFGDYGYRLNDITMPPKSESRGHATFTLEGIDPRTEGPDLILAGDFLMNYRPSPSGTLAYDFELRQDKAIILVSETYQTPMRYIYREFEVGDNIALSMTDMVPANTQAITIPADADQYTSVYVYGTNAYGTLNYFRSQPERTSSTVIMVPVIPEAKFTSFETSISFDIGNYSYGYRVKGNDIPAMTKQIDGKLEYSRKDNTVTLGVINADIMSIDATTGKSDNFIAWKLLSGGNTTVTLPQLPQTLIDTYGLATFADLLNARSARTFVYDYKEYDGYTDYLNKNLKPTTAPPAITESMYYTLMVDGKDSGGRTAPNGHKAN